MEELDISQIPTWTISLPHLKDDLPATQNPFVMTRKMKLLPREAARKPCSDDQLWQNSSTSNPGFDMVV